MLVSSTWNDSDTAHIYEAAQLHNKGIQVVFKQQVHLVSVTFLNANVPPSDLFFIVLYWNGTMYVRDQVPTAYNTSDPNPSTNGLIKTYLNYTNVVQVTLVGTSVALVALAEVQFYPLNCSGIYYPFYLLMNGTAQVIDL